MVWALDFVRDLQHRLPRILPPGAQLIIILVSFCMALDGD